MRLVRDNPGACDDLVDPERPRFWLNGGDRLTHARGFKWADANQMFSGCFTILPPNDLYCGRHNSNHLSGTAPSVEPAPRWCPCPDGRWSRGLHDRFGGSRQPERRALFGATARAIARQAAKAPHGLWGALGTRASSETIEEQLNQ